MFSHIRPFVVVALLLLVSLPASSVAAAVPPDAASTGAVMGHVVSCDDPSSGNEHPMASAIVTAIGSTAKAETDEDGAFLLDGVPVQDSAVIAVMGPDGQVTAQRQNVPVWASQTLDIGDLVVGASVFGCGPDTDG